MKNISIILNAILAIAIVVLYFLFFSSSEEKQAGSGTSNDTPAELKDITLAYVFEDSLLTNYEYFKELAGGLEKKRQDMENDYTMKAEGLQKEFEGFQRTAGNMTMNQARAVEEDLLQKRQNLMLLQEKLGQDLLKAESDVNNKLYGKVTEYLERYARENGYALILNVKRGNAILYADKGMNVTDAVVQGLNEEYNQSTAGAVKTPVAKDTTSTQ